MKTIEQVKEQLMNEYRELGQKRSAHYFNGIHSEQEIEDVTDRMKQIDKDLDLIFAGIDPRTGNSY